MTDASLAPAREWTKLFAFVRRDVLVLFSYRLAFLADIANLAFQGLSFYFVSLMIDPVAMPEYGEERASYMAFVAIGIAFGAFMQVGLGRVVTAIRNEQVLGTLESLFMTPTRPLTLQIGLVVYDLLYVPVRTAIFLGIIMVGFGVQFDLASLGPAFAILLVFILMVWGLGMLGAGAVLTFRRGGGIVGFVGAAVSVSSGAYFPLELLPSPIATILETSPVAVAFDAARRTLIGGEKWADVDGALLYIGLSALVALALGLWAVRAAIRRERRMGTLSHY
ncbi:MAG: ABC transporter permease [Actinomycetota bacterium]